jgi:hypothetical protein
MTRREKHGMSKRPFVDLFLLALLSSVAVLACDDDGEPAGALPEAGGGAPAGDSGTVSDGSPIPTDGRVIDDGGGPPPYTPPECASSLPACPDSSGITLAERYAMQRLQVVEALRPASSDLAEELEGEVKAILDARSADGFLRPLYLEIGIRNAFSLFGNSAEEAFVLSEALPYVSSSLQSQIREYLKVKLADHDPTLHEQAFRQGESNYGSRPLDGNRREYFSIPTAPDPEPLEFNVWPPVNPPAETLYMLWRYADATGDWDYLGGAGAAPSGERFDRLKALFAAVPDTPTRYGEIAAAIGYARILQHYDLSSDPAYARALSIVGAGIGAGTDFDAFLDLANTLFIADHGHAWSFPPFHYALHGPIGIHFAPEIGRLLRDNALEAVRARVTENPLEGQDGQYNAIEARWPEWYLVRGEYPPTRHFPPRYHYGENHMVTPDIPWALYMVHAYVYEEDAPTLRRYIDVPYGRGDLCHIQRLVAAIQAHGCKVWCSSSVGS